MNRVEDQLDELFSMVVQLRTDASGAIEDIEGEIRSIADKDLRLSMLDTLENLREGVEIDHDGWRELKYMVDEYTKTHRKWEV